MIEMLTRERQTSQNFETTLPSDLSCASVPHLASTVSTTLEHTNVSSLFQQLRAQPRSMSHTNAITLQVAERGHRHPCTYPAVSHKRSCMAISTAVSISDFDLR